MQRGQRRRCHGSDATAALRPPTVTLGPTL
jgi:hypothetical protein